MESFPYKKEFITNPEELWNAAQVLDLAEFRVLEGPLNNNLLPRQPKTRTDRHPKGKVKYEFQGVQLALLTDPSAYERVNILTDYFAEGARLQAHVHGCPTPLEYFKNNEQSVLAKAQERHIAHPEQSLRYHIREVVYESTKECTTFAISLTKAILKYFQAKKVLDPSAGWGDRLLGAAAAGVDAYHGVDPNPRMTDVYRDMIRFTQPAGDYYVISANFLEVDIQEGGYDTVFTSPPFYNYEVYSADEKQSIHGITTVDQWINKFFIPYLNKAWRALAKGGHLILYISDVPTGNYLGRMLEHMDTLRAEYLGVIYVARARITSGWPLWVWRK